MSPEEQAALLFMKLPIAEIARAIASRAQELGLVWRLRPATVVAPTPAGQVQMTYDGDSVAVAATSLIGRLPVGARVMAIDSPPAGNHIIGFLGADFPPSVPGEAIGRPQLISIANDFSLPVSSTALTAVTGLAFTAAPRAAYIVKLRASNNGDTAADIKYSWTVPSGASMSRNVIALPIGETTNSNPTTWTFARRAAGDSQANANTSAVAPSTAFPGYWEDILVRIGSTGGTVQLTAGQNATSATPTVVRADSYMEVQRYR